jgi:hypothetical protein
MRRYRADLRRHGDRAPGICVPLITTDTLFVCLIFFEIIKQKRNSVAEL